MNYPCKHGVTNYCGVCEVFDKPPNWTVDDPRMWKEQCRIGDVAFQHLFVTTHGLPVPDWVTEGLPQVYKLLETIKHLQQQLKERDGNES
jgi:hypothetical protein